MTVLDRKVSLSGDALRAACATLGVGRPLGLADPTSRDPATTSAAGATDHGFADIDERTAIALAVLAAPEAIAVVERTFAGHVHTTYVATRNADAAVHRIHRDRHFLEWHERHEATHQLLAAAALTDNQRAPSPFVPTVVDEAVDVTKSAYDRMIELVAKGDLRRGAAALASDGVDPTRAGAVAAASQAATVYALGLRSLGLRYEGCELAWVGDHDRRWLVPLPTRHAVTAAVVAALVEPRHLRVRIEPVTIEFLRDELATLFA